ncbi:type VII secretion target [Micromonospora purpureochromogenes]|uniref:type VII secretion target n=1 Tax=Micromonospora purpureochromogenes TaxID=47872 RepID=UPI00363A3FAE
MVDADALHVDPAGLRAVAVRVVEVGEDLGKSASSRPARLTPGGTAGWSMVDAAKTASAAWEAFVRQLADSVSGVATDLRTTADSYERTDLDAAQRFRPDRRFPD